MNLLRQTPSEPLFPKLLWSRPENKRLAGKLLVVGGNLHGFSAPAQAYSAALTAGIGEVRAVLPDAIQKVVGGFFEHAIFLPSTPSGSFARKGLSDLIDACNWADGIFLAGDFGRNSETTVVLELLLKEYKGRVTLTKDAISGFQDSPTLLLNRDKTTLVMNMQQLQKIAVASNFDKPFIFDMPVEKLADQLSELTKINQASLVVKRLKQIFVANNGGVNLTNLSEDPDMWRVSTASYCAVWATQHPAKSYEALTCSIFSLYGEDDKLSL